MSWAPAQKPGDTDPLIEKAKNALSKFSYGKGLGTGNEYTVAFGVALRQWQANIHYQVAFKSRPGPDVNLLGVFDWATKTQLGLIGQPASEARKPVILTVAGHLGDMLTGPAYLTARWLEERGLVRVQPVGYDNVSLPFRNSTGISELGRLVNDPVVLPFGTPWMLFAHSQGGICASTFYLDSIRPNVNMWPHNHFRGGLMFGNPYRQRGTVAPWVLDPPDADSEGLSNRHIDNTPANWAEVARKGDLYADTKGDDPATEWKRAIYRAVQNEWTGADSLAEQLGELATNFGPEVWAIVRAIIDGVRGAAGLDKHNVFDLGPGIDFARRQLAI